MTGHKSLCAALRALCARPVHDVEELGLHVAATGNAYTFAKSVLGLLDENEARLCYEAHVEQQKLAYPPYDPKPWAEQDEAVREAWLEHIDRHYAEGGV